MTLPSSRTTESHWMQTSATNGKYREASERLSLSPFSGSRFKANVDPSAFFGSDRVVRQCEHAGETALDDEPGPSVRRRRKVSFSLDDKSASDLRRRVMRVPDGESCFTKMQTKFLAMISTNERNPCAASEGRAGGREGFRKLHRKDGWTTCLVDGRASRNSPGVFKAERKALRRPSSYPVSAVGGWFGSTHFRRTHR